MTRIALDPAGRSAALSRPSPRPHPSSEDLSGTLSGPLSGTGAAGGRPARPVTRRGLLGGLAAAASLAATPAFASSPAPPPPSARPSAPSLLRGRGAFRSVSLTNGRTGEWLDTVYWADGAYIPEALAALDHILRDWREDEACRMHPNIIDILAATRQLLACQEPFEVVSGYRTPETNTMLRRRLKGVALNSYHLKGMAVDITMKSRTVRQIGGAGLALHAGGVGRYTRSDFVHLDCGPVRKWGA